MSTFREKVLYQVIGLKLHEVGGFTDPEIVQHLLEGSGVPLRNVCVRMHPAAKARLQAMLRTLDLSLQTFLTMAIDEAISDALKIVEAEGFMAGFDQAFKEELEAERIRLVPIDGQPDNFRFDFMDESKGGEA